MLLRPINPMHINLSTSSLTSTSLFPSLCASSFTLSTSLSFIYSCFFCVCSLSTFDSSFCRLCFFSPSPFISIFFSPFLYQSFWSFYPFLSFFFLCFMILPINLTHFHLNYLKMNFNHLIQIQFLTVFSIENINFLTMKFS